MSDNKSINDRRVSATPRGVPTATEIFADRAENAELWCVEGRRYIDFAGGIAVLNTGHRHPAVVARVEEQLKRFTHTAYQVVPYEAYVELAEKLNALAPGSSPKKTFFVTTGAEANENAVKIARAHTGRAGVIAFVGGFHGRTHMAMALTGKVVPYKKGFGPLPGEVYHLPFPIPNHGVSVADSLAALDRLFTADVGPERVAAMIIEPVQGEGGFYIAPQELLDELRSICDAHGIVLIADEIQTGFARTGRTFATEHFDIEPDIITVAKSLGGGFPIAGVIGKADIMDAPEPGAIGGTFAGNPLACAAALGVLEVIEAEGLNARSAQLGEIMQARLRQMRDNPALAPIGDIRGLGAMVGFELVTAPGGNTPDPDATKALCATALANGLIILACGIFGNTVRILVPLTASDAIVEEGLDILERSLADIQEGRAAAE